MSQGHLPSWGGALDRLRDHALCGRCLSRIDCTPGQEWEQPWTKEGHTVSDNTTSHDHGDRETIAAGTIAAGTSAAKVRQDPAPLILAGSAVRIEPDGEPEHLAETGGGSGGQGDDLPPRSLC